MHAYGTNSNERATVFVKLFPVATAAVILSMLLVGALAEALKFDTPVWLQALFGGPSATWALLWSYNWLEESGWRNPRLRRWLRIRIPDLNGRWKVEGKTSYVAPNDVPQESDSPPMREWTATVVIAQTWSRISIHLEAAGSSSCSRSASVLIEQVGGYPSVVYEYLNTPKPGARTTMEIHRGLCQLLAKQNDCTLVLEGEYFTHPRDRGNFGWMRLERIPND